MAHYRTAQSSPEDDINILLLGETGVGKTTFINAFVNCLWYNTLDNALDDGMKVLIPSSFAVSDGETFESVRILVGDRNNEENLREDGESVTQSCHSYIFPVGNRKIRFIDGPGVGDTRGVDHEARNFEHILRYINQYEHLNGICILLRPDQPRLNIYFRYCIKELLRHLHVNAKDNLMFVFTNSRATFFRPGATTTILKALLKDLREKTGVEVPFQRDNSFMFDSDSFRYLAVCRQGLTFLDREKASYNESWKKSVEEYARLITRILKCDLHAVQETQSLNEVQILIHKLSRPIAEIATLIQENISLAQRYKTKLLRDPTGDRSNRVPQKAGKFVPLPKRLTVCVNDKCTEVVNVRGEHRVNYNSDCHVGCSLHRVVQECIGHPVIRGCRALKQTGSCRKCGCDWTKHMHITYRYERNLSDVVLENDDRAATPQSIMSLIDRRIADLRKEEAAIRSICVKLSQFLKAYSITPFNDDIIEYLRHHINEERQKQIAGTDNAEIIRGLEKMVADYTEEMNLYSNSIARADNSNSPDNFDNAARIDEVYRLVQQLYELPINGKFIEDQVRGMSIGRAQAATTDEHRVDLPTGPNVPQILSTIRDVVNRRR